MTAQPVEPDPIPETPTPDPSAEPAPAEPAGEDNGDATPERIQQPAEFDPGEGKVVALVTERGSLTLRPGQKKLDPEQRASLLAIGIDVERDPGVLPHLRGFVHMCQTKALDPWAREAYLIGRGRDENRTYTMQVGIDGYRKMSGSTGRFIRVKETLWTGMDDDDKSYVAMDDGQGGVIMRRVWYDQWPASRKYPGAAKVIIEHYDEFGNIQETAAVADWGMYAPFVDEWEWGERRGQKVYKTDPETGERVRKLNDMWEKGYAHMLAKCAEALAHRKAFPARMSGIYTHEEMHAADQQERNRLAASQRQARAAAYVEQTGQQPSEPIAPEDPKEPAGPIPVGDVMADMAAASPQSTAPSDQPAPAAEPVDEETEVAWLREELEFQAETLGHSVASVAGRAVKMYRKNIEDFNVGELGTLVAAMRGNVATKMPEPLAEQYAALGPDTDLRDVRSLLGFETPTDEDVVDAEEVTEVDPDAEHPYVDDNGSCDTCGLPEDVGPHPET